MICDGPRELAIPKWFWAAVPLASLLYVGFDLGWGAEARRSPFDPSEKPGLLFLVMMTRFATTWLAAFLIMDVVARSRTPWYGLPLLFVAAWTIAEFVVTNRIAQEIAALAIVITSAFIAVAERHGFDIAPPPALLIPLAALFVLGIAAALLATLSSRLMAGLRVLVWGTLRECSANLAGAVLWMLVAVLGFAGIAFQYDPKYVPLLLPVLAACGGGLVAGSLHLYLVDRSRRRQAADGRMNIWIVSGLCIVALAFKPELIGPAGLIASRDYVRPALRAVGVLPTPVLQVAGYRIDVPYNARTVQHQSQSADGGYLFVGVQLPAEYGLTTDKYDPYVSVFHRGAVVYGIWPARKQLDEAGKVAKPGEDLLVKHPTPTRHSLALRMQAFPELEFEMDFDPATPWDVAERALRKFLQERLRRAS